MVCSVRSGISRGGRVYGGAGLPGAGIRYLLLLFLSWIMSVFLYTDLFGSFKEAAGEWLTAVLFCQAALGIFIYVQWIRKYRASVRN
jgi:hypothetical protein